MDVLRLFLLGLLPCFGFHSFLFSLRLVDLFGCVVAFRIFDYHHTGGYVRYPQLFAGLASNLPQSFHHMDVVEPERIVNGRVAPPVNGIDIGTL